MNNHLIFIILSLSIIIHNQSNLEIFLWMINFLNMKIVLFIYLIVNNLDQKIQFNIEIQNKLILKILKAFLKCLKVALFFKIIISRFITKKDQNRNSNKILFILLFKTHQFRKLIESKFRMRGMQTLTIKFLQILGFHLILNLFKAQA